LFYFLDPAVKPRDDNEAKTNYQNITHREEINFENISSRRSRQRFVIRHPN
jgi:hypothetical protein